MSRHVSVLFLLCLLGFSASAAPLILAQTQINKPLTIISKPRPSYTDEARKDNIQGLVLVRVTFLANGKIGDVADVAQNDENLRKYGLVKATIEAAKRIKFEPAVKNGKPVKMTKILEYRFTLY